MTVTKNDELPAFTRRGINLASAGLGAVGISATDAFFAPLERMLEDQAAVFIADKYDDNGKWMDGWETRRRRDGGPLAQCHQGNGDHDAQVRLEGEEADEDPGGHGPPARQEVKRTAEQRRVGGLKGSIAAEQSVAAELPEIARTGYSRTRRG